MYRVTFVSSMFSPDGATRDESLRTMQLYLDSQVKANQLIMARRSLPPLRDVALRYERRFAEWRDCLDMLANGAGGEQDFAAYRAAELRKMGVPARAFILVDSDDSYRCVVRYPAEARVGRPSAHVMGLGNGLVEENPLGGFRCMAPKLELTVPRKITFVSRLFSAGGADRAESHATLQLYLDTLTAANLILIQTRNLPSIYAAGVRYVAEPPGVEDWYDLLWVHKKKQNDCEDLAAARTAELHKAGALQPRSVFQFFQHPITLEQRYHCLTQFGLPIGGSVHPTAKVLPNGLYLEDPSKVLGMRGAY